MKNKPLFFQVWVVLVLSLFAFIAVGALIISRVSYEFFANQAYDFLEKTQDYIIEKHIEQDVFIREDKDERVKKIEENIGFYGGVSINHVIFDRQGEIILATVPLNQDFYREVMDNARKQSKETASYKTQIAGIEYYYVLRTVYTEDRVDVFGRESNYFATFVASNYRNNFLQALLHNFIFILIASLIPAGLLARYMINPLLKLEKRVNQIARREWKEPIKIDRKDEIGRLMQSVELMREELYKEDQAQKAFFHNVSHNLKTPVMVIRSYAEAIKDGIFSREEEIKNLELISEEAQNLETQIRSLLLLAKLDYFGQESLKELRRIDLRSTLEELWERVRYQRMDITWELKLEDAQIKGDREHIKVCLENIMENQLKYAKSRIRISIEKKISPNKVEIIFSNDGNLLDEDMREKIFEEFSTGKKGNIGLGLSIVKKIMRLHGGEVWAANEADEVAFHLCFPSSS